MAPSFAFGSSADFSVLKDSSARILSCYSKSTYSGEILLSLSGLSGEESGTYVPLVLEKLATREAENESIIEE